MVKLLHQWTTGAIVAYWLRMSTTERVVSDPSVSYRETIQLGQANCLATSARSPNTHENLLRLNKYRYTNYDWSLRNAETRKRWQKSCWMWLGNSSRSLRIRHESNHRDVTFMKHRRSACDSLKCATVPDCCMHCLSWPTDTFGISLALRRNIWPCLAWEPRRSRIWSRNRQIPQ